MERILVLGNPGSGKSTFAAELGRNLGRDVTHLDDFYCLPGGKTLDPDSWEKVQQELVNKNRWIIEGMYPRILPIRLARADTVIFLDLPNELALARAVKRRLTGSFTRRVGAPDYYQERLPWTLAKKILTFPRQELISKLRALEGEKTIVILRGPKEARKYLAGTTK